MQNPASAYVLLLLLAITFPVLAAIDDHTFASEEQEARYHKLIDEMRCPMCLNANLSGSDAPIAADLRAEILEQLESGRSDREIMDFMKARYGDFITYRPPLNSGTVLLWFGPLALLLLGFFVLRRLLRASPDDNVDGTLSSTEREQLDSLLHTPSSVDGKDQART